MTHLRLLPVLALAFAAAAHADDTAPPPATPSHAEVSVNVGNDDDTAAAVINALPADVRSQLSSDQIAAIIEREQKGGRHDDSAVAIAVPLAFFVCIIGIVVALLYAGFRKQRQLHETLRAMIEKGVDIPPALLVPPKKTGNDRRRGTILTSVGLAIAASLAVVDKDHSGIWALGLVPVALGVGYLLAWAFEKRDEKQSAA